MKFSEQTKKILENYATISDNIIIAAAKDGETNTLLQTCDKNKMLVAQTYVPEVLANDVCLNNLKAFLSAVSVLKDPDISFATDHMILSDGSSNVRIVYGNPLTVTRLTKKVTLPAAAVSFTLKEETFSKLLSLSGILALPDLKLFSKDGKILFQVLDRKNPSTNTGGIEVGEGDLGNTEYFFQRELLKMIPGDYDVEIAGTYSLFKSKAHDNLEYIIALSV